MLQCNQDMKNSYKCFPHNDLCSLITEKDCQTAQIITGNTFFYDLIREVLNTALCLRWDSVCNNICIQAYYCGIHMVGERREKDFA